MKVNAKSVACSILGSWGGCGSLITADSLLQEISQEGNAWLHTLAYVSYLGYCIVLGN